MCEEGGLGGGSGWTKRMNREFSLRQHKAAAAKDGVPWRKEDTTWPQQETSAFAAAREEKVASSQRVSEGFFKLLSS